MQPLAEIQLSRKNNIVGDLLKPSTGSASEENPVFQLELDELLHDGNSITVFREREPCSKREYVFRKHHGGSLIESDHTWSLLPTGTTSPAYCQCDIFTPRLKFTLKCKIQVRVLECAEQITRQLKYFSRSFEMPVEKK